jgi:hypothetical protein
MRTTNSMKRYYWFFIILAVVSVAAIASNAMLRRGPVHDSLAADDLRAIQQNVDNFYIAHSQLPKSVSTLRLTGDVAKRVGQYDYAVTGPNSYQLCANFLTFHHSTNRYPATNPLLGQVADPDEHGKGQQCFSYQVIPVASPAYPYGVK